MSRRLNAPKHRRKEDKDDSIRPATSCRVIGCVHNQVKADQKSQPQRDPRKLRNSEYAREISNMSMNRRRVTRHGVFTDADTERKFP